MQWVNVGNEVTAHAVNTNKCADLHLLFHHGFFTIHWRCVRRPLNWLVRNIKTAEDVVVEAMATQQQFVNPLQEQSTLGTLNDAMVVRTCNCDNLRHAECIQVCRVTALEFSGVINRPDADNDSLSWHQTRN